MNDALAGKQRAAKGLLDLMDIPTNRKDISKKTNLRWLIKRPRPIMGNRMRAESSMESRMRQCWEKIKIQMSGFEPHSEVDELTDGKAFVNFFEVFERDLRLPLGLASHLYLDWLQKGLRNEVDLFHFMAQQIGLRLGVRRSPETKIYVE